MLFTGGTVVTADGSFRADVLVEDEKIVAVGSGRFVERSFKAANVEVKV